MSYKRASRNMQHALRVDNIDPSKGFVSSDDADYIIATADNLSLQDCERESRQIATELAKLQNELIIAKRSNNKEATRDLGHKIQGFVQRSATYRKRIIELRQRDQAQILGDAIRAIAPIEMQYAIFDEAKRIQEEWFK